LEKHCAKVRETDMRHFAARRILIVAGVAWLTAAVALGQSLGDVARENREKQNAEDGSAQTPKPKVITNKDLPKDPDSDVTPEGGAVAHVAPSAPANTANSITTNRAADRHYAQQRAGEQRAAEQWKRQILAQKTKMANLQARIDQVQASIRAANGEVQTEQPFNHYQARQVQQMALMQQQLNEQRIKLDQMQDEARRAGMHTVVYDP
jgi:hypothetical protein